MISFFRKDIRFPFRHRYFSQNNSFHRTSATLVILNIVFTVSERRSWFPTQLFLYQRDRRDFWHGLGDDIVASPLLHRCRCFVSRRNVRMRSSSWSFLDIAPRSEATTPVWQRRRLRDSFSLEEMIVLGVRLRLLKTILVFYSTWVLKQSKPKLYQCVPFNVKNRLGGYRHSGYKKR